MCCELNTQRYNEGVKREVNKMESTVKARVEEIEVIVKMIKEGRVKTKSCYEEDVLNTFVVDMERKLDK